MGAEKQGSKGGGGYVGGFFQFFDWNTKSRKKLFSSKTDLPEQSKQKKRSDGNLPTTSRLHLMDEDEIVERSSIKGNSDYSCASSVTDEEGCGNRGPGVVARLMGLDSLPTSNFVEPYSSPFFDSQSLQDAHYHRRNLDFRHDHQIMHSSNLLNNVEAPFRVMGPKPQKMINRPIEKFQTEILPPKSAKSVPITHHKLLSPIKSSGFIPSKDAAHIMEAAVKIIEPGPQATTKSKRPLVSSSSVPLKVRDLKEKVEAAQKLSRLHETSRRPVESNAAKYLKGQSMNNSWNGSVGTTLFKGSYSEECTAGLNNKGKSISLALQAKVNVQKREGLNPSGSRSLFGEKEQIEIVSSQPFKSQPNIQKNTHKKPSTHVTSTVLKQNNQKQNCAMEREKLPSKPLVSNSRGKKTLSGDSSIGRHKSSSKILGNSKIGSRSGSIAADYKKEVPFSGTKNVCRKKRSIDGNFHFEKNHVVDNMLTYKNAKPIESNSVIDGHFSWAEDSNRKGMDVVSFTFTAPMTKLTPGFETSRQVKEKNDGFSADYQGKKVLHNSDSTNRTKLSSLGGDALSILLEQKLRELTHGVESSSYKAETASSSASVFQDMVPSFKAVNSTSMFHDKRSQEEMHADKLGCQYVPDFSSTAPQSLVTKYKLQGMEEMDECSSNYAESRKLLDYRHPSPISVLEPSFLTESCNSVDSTNSNSTEGSKQCSSVQSQEVLVMGSSKKIYLVEADAELSDSASSTSSRTVARMHVTSFSVKDSIGSTGWELKYVEEILCNVELMFKDFALGRTSEIINPHLFDQLESRKGVLESHGDKPKLKRKVLFDCVSECMDLRCRSYAGGGCRTWGKGLLLVRRKEWLAEEIYKEISGWSDMADFMVDELVDKDMSTQYGKWLDFEVEAFELGVEIEKRILNSLVEEVVADIL